VLHATALLASASAFRCCAVFLRSLESQRRSSVQRSRCWRVAYSVHLRHLVIRVHPLLRMPISLRRLFVRDVKGGVEHQGEHARQASARWLYRPAPSSQEQVRPRYLKVLRREAEALVHGRKNDALSKCTRQKCTAERRFHIHGHVLRYGSWTMRSARLRPLRLGCTMATNRRLAQPATAKRKRRGSTIFSERTDNGRVQRLLRDELPYQTPKQASGFRPIPDAKP
jgi:hypothetical protein